MALIMSLDFYASAILGLPVLRSLPVMLSDGIIWFFAVVGEVMVIHAVAFMLALFYRATVIAAEVGDGAD